MCQKIIYLIGDTLTPKKEGKKENYRKKNGKN